MQFFGWEISRPIAAAEPKPTKKGLEVGDSGTRILDGIISEEYNNKLADVRGIAVYDEMRKSDGTVRAAVQAVTLPVRSANWFVKPATEEQADQDIADFVTACLWERKRGFDPTFRIVGGSVSLRFGFDRWA